ncbi:TadE-like protein [Propionibacterium cyclohexanicum]|uniref:TadE-like protein n=1 Tax=Propionibacterium cyclohexanicum TaxID=64702 RepID=A0A1H9TH51_9ACTN|nr:TadE/TadG family type IV pilus assembly protein [Propionibacterium cyclohexanicum]SER96545.1 TadE-like protein [Propionibacterium cyclohexanicum]
MSEALSWAVLAPLLLVTVLGVVDAGVWLHARSIVQQAALTAAEDQALAGVPDGSAERIVEQMTGELLDVTTSTSTTDELVSVTVEARVPLALDLGLGEVSARAVRPRER